MQMHLHENNRKGCLTVTVIHYQQQKAAMMTVFVDSTFSSFARRYFIAGEASSQIVACISFKRRYRLALTS